MSQGLDAQVLFERAARGDEEAVACLLEHYKGLVRQRASRYFLEGGERDDLIQEGMLALYAAICKNRAQESAAFLSFARRCIDNRLADAVRKAKRLKHGPLNAALSLAVGLGEGQGPVLGDTIKDTRRLDPEDQLLQAERHAGLKAFMARSLSALEREALVGQAQGHAYADLGKRLGKSPKAIDGALQRARRKLRKFLKEEGDV